MLCPGGHRGRGDTVRKSLFPPGSTGSCFSVESCDNVPIKQPCGGSGHRWAWWMAWAGDKAQVPGGPRPPEKPAGHWDRKEDTPSPVATRAPASCRSDPAASQSCHTGGKGGSGGAAPRSHAAATPSPRAAVTAGAAWDEPPRWPCNRPFSGPHTSWATKVHRATLWPWSAHAGLRVDKAREPQAGLEHPSSLARDFDPGGISTLLRVAKPLGPPHL